MKTLGLVLLSLVMASVAVAEDEKSFKNESQAGVVVTGGNTNTEVYSAKTLNTWTMSEHSKLSFGGSYLEGTTEDPTTGQDVETAKRWDGFLRYDQVLNESWSIFVSQNIESDKFSGYAQRYNTDVGAKWNIVKGKKFYTFLEFGYRYTIEENVDDTKSDQGFENGERKNSKARLFYELGGDINESTKGRFWVEYIPNFDESDDWLLTFEPSLSVTLSKTFALKLAFLGIYDNQVNIAGNKKFDYTYTTSIVATF